MPVQELERSHLSTPANFAKDFIPLLLDDVNQPNPGGRREQDSLLDVTIIVKPVDRILPTTEPQTTKEYSDIDPEKYVQDEARIRIIFNRRLGITGRQQAIINYDPVLARTMVEQMVTPEDKKRFINHETTQARTALGERCNVVESSAVYFIDGSSKLRSAAFPTETFEVVVRRGIDHRRKMGSPDTEREEVEYRSMFLNIQKTFADPNIPLGYKKVVISGPSFQKGTTFTGNFVDIYELKEDSFTKQRYIEMTRFVSNATYEQHKERIVKLKSDYFNEAKGSIDVFFAEHPIDIDPRIDARSPCQIIEQLSGATKDAISKEDFQKIVEDSKPRIQYYLEAICAPVFDPGEVALRWNAVLAGADRVWNRLKGISQKVIKGVRHYFQETPVFKNITEEVAWLGRQMVEKVIAGCGLSGGFSVSGVAGVIGRFFSKGMRGIAGVLGLGGESSTGFVCPKCKFEANGPVGNTCPNCGLTKEAYARSGGQTC